MAQIWPKNKVSMYNLYYVNISKIPFHANPWLKRGNEIIELSLQSIY